MRKHGFQAGRVAEEREDVKKRAKLAEFRFEFIASRRKMLGGKVWSDLEGKRARKKRIR